ncbi:GDSL-type esterase/lipase family protein [Hydrogenophaga atypica]|uniref:GDSL-type esterase/lipase family protein n=1 Tax=Hydrogenophaga atypica TaxID=249409 RepID=A0ABW2QHF3_9BURK
MLRRTCISASVAFAAMALLVACGRDTRHQAVPTGQTVLAFGDSVTHGTGASAGEDWPTLLAAATGWQMVNAGVPGDTAQAAQARLPALLAQHRPALVIIEIGGNDFLRRRTAADVKADVRGLIQAAKGSGAQVVLVAVPALSLMAAVAGRPSDAPLYAELAEEEQVALVPEVFSRVLGDAALRTDPVHPNAAGYREMAQGLHQRLKALGIAP